MYFSLSTICELLHIWNYVLIVFIMLTTNRGLYIADIEMFLKKLIGPTLMWLLEVACFAEPQFSSKRKELDQRISKFSRSVILCWHLLGSGVAWETTRGDIDQVFLFFFNQMLIYSRKTWCGKSESSKIQNKKSFGKKEQVGKLLPVEFHPFNLL